MSNRPAGYLRDWKQRNPEKMALYRRRENLAKRGWTLEEYDAAFAAQGGVCAICGEPEQIVAKSGEPHSLSADHDHETGKPRGLLCRKCNSALGNLNDDPGLLRRALEYLESYLEEAAA